MSTILDRLLDEIEPIPGESAAPRVDFEVDAEYLDFMSVSNGGFVGGRYFHLFGASGDDGHNVRKWNAPELWKSSFDGLPEFWVIAEEFCGNQYGYKKLKGGDSRICRLSVVTGNVTRCPDTFEGLVRYLFEPPFAQSELLDAWTRVNGSIPTDSHLSYKIHPLPGGSQDDLDNFELTCRVQNIRFTGQLLSQVSQLPPGTIIRDVQVKDGQLRLIN